MNYKNINIYNDNNIFNNLYILNNNIYNINKNIIGVIENIKDIFYKITWYNNIIKEEYYFSFDCINYYKDVERHTLLSVDIKDIERHTLLDKNQGQILVSGLAKNREGLVAFIEDLKNKADFLSVESPISDFAKDSDISFTLNIKIKL